MQHRDAAALRVKLIRATHTARNHFIDIEHLTEKEFDVPHVDLEQKYGDAEPGMAASHVALMRLLAMRRPGSRRAVGSGARAGLRP